MVHFFEDGVTLPFQLLDLPIFLSELRPKALRVGIQLAFHLYQFLVQSVDLLPTLLLKLIIFLTVLNLYIVEIAFLDL